MDVSYSNRNTKRKALDTQHPQSINTKLIDLEGVKIIQSNESLTNCPDQVNLGRRAIGWASGIQSPAQKLEQRRGTDGVTGSKETTRFSSLSGTDVGPCL